jgi:hypothetical protein
VNPAARHLEHNWSKRCFDGEPKPEELTALALSIDHRMMDASTWPFG